MTIIAMGLGYSITAADPTTLSANLAEVRRSLQFSPGTASFLASLCTLTLAAAVLGAGALGDLAGMKRMFVIGIWGSIAFGVLGAVAPNVGVLIAARAGLGVAFAFVLGLSLAIINAVFPPGRRAAAIAAYLGAGHALSVFQPALGGWLASHFGWRTCLLVTPVLAACTLVITLRYVPETVRDQRKLDIIGIALIAAGLVTFIYGLTELQGGFNTGALGQVQRRADRRCHVQLPGRRRHHSLRLLPGDHPRQVAGTAWAAACSGDADRVGGRGRRGPGGRAVR